MSIRVVFSEDCVVGTIVLDDGSFKSRVRGRETPEPADLASAFDSFLKSSTRPRREGIHGFFRSYVTSALRSLELALLAQFLLFDHCNDDGPTFDDTYLCNITKLQNDLIDEVRQSLQSQTGEPIGNAAIERLLEESGLRSLFQSKSAESVLASSIDEDTAVGFRNVFGDLDGAEFATFELKLAQYRTRQEGLRVRDNQDFVSKLREEICARTSALEKPVAATSEESLPSGHAESEGIDGDQKSRTFAHRHKGRILEPERLWKHLTISRDETSASNFLHERLLVLFLNRPYTCPKHTQPEESNIRNTDAPNLAKEEQHSVSFPTYPRTGTMPEQHSSCEVPSHLTQPPDAKLSGAGSFNHMNSGTHESSTVDGNTYGHMRPHQSISSVTAIGLEERSTEGVTRSRHENWKIIHFLSETSEWPPLKAYIDKPVWGPGLKGDEFSLKAFLPVADAEGYVRQAGFDFSISREYSNQCLQPELRRASSKKQPPPEPLHHREYIRLHSQEMIEAIEAFLALQTGFWDNFPGFDAREPIEAPYMFWYIYRSKEALQQLSPSHQSLMQTLTSWIEKNYKERYIEAKSQLENGVITLRTMPFLLFPGDVLVWREKEKTKAAITSSLLARESPPILYWDSTRPWTEDSRLSEGNKKGEFLSVWTVQTWSYKFDGDFLHDKGYKKIKFKASSLDQEVPISKLGVHPLRFADEKTKIQLETRGKKFWTCRHRNLVSHIGDEGMFTKGERFMVDFEIYRQLHSDSLKFQLLYEREEMEDDDEEGRYKMSVEEMASETPPPAPEIYVFPATVPGYNLRSKKWVDLEVDLISDVEWNTKSFDNLVIDAKAKELIQALISHQIESEKGTDLIRRKGNGLIILLHGGPGTGKTFTAESVAEIAQKPLFCVTCGDIGTKPEEVEKYLESVLYLGKTWGCVVLIDEAEVFLEQRSLDNLERNALVSVFLRVLEYYEGILILTTNRVGTFDEAFKSRILLSLHYDTLTKGQRQRIWRGFINHLEDTNVPSSGKDSGRQHHGASSGPAATSSKHNSTADLAEIDYQGLRDYLEDLARHELNGRQIRNIITTARQLAKFRKKTLDYGLVQEVILESGKFDEYFSKVNDNQSDEQIARSDGLR